MNEFDKLVNLLFVEEDMKGHYDSDKFSITLYDVENELKNFNQIQDKIDNITLKYRWITLSPNDKHTNINLLDIGL